ncbi:MAG TPA: hypothetical protein IGS53_22140 [Leptolyngbyaceae cyanobacterium M33_DOE_097]|uniref:Uncharacterized protein n=1 Tax=Oscillatoriales cyanobacterium SpSt-418 TaxID=2282169 RepID=A0A7C3PHI8_9CYAN|nr:hypothetical protein [Leptolyngbyaceae cyanobacterium M33_DOE_097]
MIRRYMRKFTKVILGLSAVLCVVLISFKQVQLLPHFTPAEFQTSQAIAATPVQASDLLTLSDIPLGFQAFPEKWMSYVNQGVNTIHNYFKASDISIDRYFGYVNLAAFELILGFAAPLKPQEIATLDARLNRPTAGEQFIAGLKQSTDFLQPLKVKSQGQLSDLGAIGDTATGRQYVMSFKGLPYALFVDIVAFRRNQTAALVMAGSFGVPSRIAKVQTLAQTLDSKLQNK